MSFNNNNEINGITVITNNELYWQLPAIIQSKKFIKFVDSLDTELLKISHIEIKSSTWFCSPADLTPERINPDRLGFLTVNVQAEDRSTGKVVPGVAFIRGDAVAVFMVVRFNGIDYVVLTEQIRLPMGKKVREIPAGMMDASSNFAGVAMKEISEETGLVPPSEKDMILLGNPIEPSAGGCDERIQLFFWRTAVDEANYEKMRNAVFGAEDENESIRLVFIPLSEYENKLTTEINDVKAICAYMRAKTMCFV